MYNYQVFLQNQREEQKEIRRQSNQTRQSIRHTYANKNLIGKHQQRLERIIKQAATDAIEVYRQPHQIKDIQRSIQKEKNVGPEIKINLESQKDRIKRKLQQNSITDPIPQRISPSRHQFRERAKSKEIHSQMRFTNHRPLQSVTERIKGGNLYYLDSALQRDFIKSEKIFLNRSQGYPKQMRKSYLSSQFTKHIFDDLHKKTYFKTIQQTAMRIPGSSRCGDVKNQDVNYDVYTPRSNKSNHRADNDDKQFSLSKLSKDALFKAKLIIPHKRNKEVLKPITKKSDVH